MKKLIKGLLVVGVLAMSSVSVFAAYPIGDGVDTGRYLGKTSQKDVNARYNSEEYFYESSGFKTGVWIASGDEFRTKGNVGFDRPYQSNRDKPYESISITYQVYNTTSNDNVEDSKTLRGSKQHSDFSLDTRDTYSKIYLNNNDGVYAEVDGTLTYN